MKTSLVESWLCPIKWLVVNPILAAALSLNLAASTNQWNIVWSDEFNGSSINLTKWTFDLGDNCPQNCNWGNQELEYYTSRTNNAYVANGVLHIVARQESYAGYSFTSARMKTQGRYSTPAYGRFEWRAKLPSGVGMWPALWMLGTNITTVGWPTCGEIDVVENNGATPTWVQGSLHWGPSGGEINRTATYNFVSPDSVTNWHTYDLIWNPGSIQFYVDGNPYENDTGLSTPFNAPFFFIMNLAVGGTYVGQPIGNTNSIGNIEAGTVFPQEMQVDYVRVYEQTAPLAIAVTPQSDGSLSLSWPTNIVCHLQVQTNSIVGGNWSDLPVSTSPYVVTPDPTQTVVFYRLASP
jgi:beta-glucanase (GH16 family)